MKPILKSLLFCKTHTSYHIILFLLNTAVFPNSISIASFIFHGDKSANRIATLVNL